jgi:hypothetical protein
LFSRTLGDVLQRTLTGIITAQSLRQRAYRRIPIQIHACDVAMKSFRKLGLNCRE